MAVKGMFAKDDIWPQRWDGLQYSISTGRRVIAIDTGINNMGFASLLFTEDTARVEKLDWRPLQTGTKKKRSMGRVELIRLVKEYVVTVLICNKEVLVPDAVLIEQSFTSNVKGFNIKTTSIEIALISIFADYFPDALIKSVRPPTKGKEGKKRSSFIAFESLEQLPMASERWSKYLYDLMDDDTDDNLGKEQHVCDALVMILNHTKYLNCQLLVDQITLYDSDTAGV